MADWIKMRGGLLTNPKVIRMSRLLAENRFFMDWFTRGTRKQCDDTVYELCDVTVVTRVTVGSLLSVWSAVNEASQEDGFIKGITLFEVDEMAGVPGFGDAMMAVGWVEETDDGLIFPNFQEHNTVGKARQTERSSGAKTAAQRTKEWRERKKQKELFETRDGDVTVTSHGDHREEKRREEKNISLASSRDDSFDRFWAAWPSTDRKAAKAKCAERWAKAKLSAEADTIIGHVESMKSMNRQWREGYEPAPLTYLNQRRWEDGGEQTGADHPFAEAL